MSDIEWLNFCINEAKHFGHEEKASALERIRAHLKPDREQVARAICAACGENPEHTGDAQGNAKRWQDYLEVADRYIATMAGSQAPETDNAQAEPATIEALTRYDLCVDGVGNHTVCPCPDGEFLLASDVAGLIDKVLEAPTAAPVPTWDGHVKTAVAIINAAKSRPFTVAEKAELLMLASMLDATNKEKADD